MSVEKAEASEAISDVFNDWLNTEVRSSAGDYLDDYTAAVRGLKGGINHKDNFLALKHESHVHNRLPQAWETFVISLEPNNPEEQREYMSAWLMFTPLMQVSGTFRTQCYLEAQNAEDYLVRRQARPSGINMQNTVAERLKVWLPNPDNFADASLTVEELGRQLKIVSEVGEKAVKRVCARAVIGYDLKQEGSRSAREMVTAQYNWASFAANCVVLAAKLRRGDLAAVPFLEPKSISATPPPQVIYPLAA